MRALRRWAGPLLFGAAVLAAAELLLRAGGFRYAHYPVSMRYVRTLAGLGTDQTLHKKRFHIEYGLHPVLLWRPLPQEGVTNSDGLLGPEWTPEKAPGVARVIALGDSCTVAGEEPYPSVLSQRLQAGKFQVWNAGVGSWSSYQGLRLLELRVLDYRPDVVTLYFGWNDHWLAWAAPDKELSALLDRQWRSLKLIEKSRLLQALQFAADKLRGGTPRFTGSTPFRVAPDDYEANLKRMVALVRARGGETVLVTAPTVLTPEHPLTRSLCTESHNFHDPARINEVHDAYNERVRRAARETGAPLVDLAAEFAGRKDKESLFTDGIHLSAKGHRFAAALLEPAVRKAAKREPSFSYTP
jgi:lysophospholipase L1-like esterase